MVPILLGYYSPHGAVIMSPLFFGIAHFHHMIERIRRGQDFKTAFFISSFQFAYTTVFGMYSAFLFVRTGHLASCVIGKIFFFNRQFCLTLVLEIRFCNGVLNQNFSYQPSDYLIKDIG